jgi:hypothetical protein
LPLLVVKARGKPPSLLKGRLEPGLEELERGGPDRSPPGRLGRSEYGCGVPGRLELGRAA